MRIYESSLHRNSPLKPPFSNHAPGLMHSVSWLIRAEHLRTSVDLGFSMAWICWNPYHSHRAKHNLLLFYTVIMSKMLQSFCVFFLQAHPESFVAYIL